MSKFTDETLVPGETVDVGDDTSSLGDGLGTNSRTNVPRSRSSARVLPRDSREAARDEFECSVGFSSVVKCRALDKKRARLPRV